ALAADDAWSRGCPARRCVLAVSFCYWCLSFERSGKLGHLKHTIVSIDSNRACTIDGYVDIVVGLGYVTLRMVARHARSTFSWRPRVCSSLHPWLIEAPLNRSVFSRRARRSA